MNGTPQAGILIYTAAADSDGTLGGWVDLGKPESLGPLFEQALNRATICSSDPLCAEHDAEKDRSLHGAACHAYSLVAETSCERGNRYLDRSLLIPTLERVDAAFFKVRQTTDDFSGKPGSMPVTVLHGDTIQSTLNKRESLPVELALRLSELIERFPSEPFMLRLITGSKVNRVRVKPVAGSDLKAGQRVVLASPFLRLRGAPVSIVAGSFSISTLIDAVTEEPFILVSVNGEGGLAQAKMPAAVWNSLKSIGLIEDLI
jgi:hypothetical protein